MRTANLSDPTSWRGWNGSSFTVAFVNPYVAGWGSSSSSHVCAVLEDPLPPARGLPRGAHHQPTVNQGLVWNVETAEFIAVLWNTGHDPAIADGAPFAVATSKDLISWSEPVPLPLPPDLPDGQLAYPSLLDPDALSRGHTSFDTIDNSPTLYFGLANPLGTTLANHWDSLIRVPLRFS